jgi:hypothetical protein
MSALSDKALVATYGEIMRELNRREIIRSYNNPVGDLGERQVCDLLGLRLVDKSVKGYDAVTADGLVKYQIKTRWRGARGWRNLGGLRDLDERLFDRIAVAILNERTYAVGWLFHFPYAAAVELARPTTRGFKRITLTEQVLKDPRTEWVVRV